MEEGLTTFLHWEKYYTRIVSLGVKGKLYEGVGCPNSCTEQKLGVCEKKSDTSVMLWKLSVLRICAK